MRKSLILAAALAVGSLATPVLADGLEDGARYFQRAPLAEIAAAANTTERAIEGRLARVREKLRRSVLQILATRNHED